MFGRFAVKVSLAAEIDGCKAHCAEREGRVCEFGSAVSVNVTPFAIIIIIIINLLSNTIKEKLANPHWCTVDV